MSPFDPRIHQVQAATAAAFFFQRNFEQSEQLGREALERFPLHPVLTRYHAAALVQINREEEAKQVIERFKAANPLISIAALQVNFRHEWMRGRPIDSLRKAGFPE